MGITINNMTLVQVGQAVKTESLFLKLSKLISALVVAITAIVCMSYFVVGHKNVNALQSNCTSLLAENLQVYCTNSTLYDFNFQDGPFTDDEEAKHLQFLLGNCDAKCQTIGTRWSYVYILGTQAWAFYMFQSILLALGVWMYPFRIMAIFLQPWFCINNLAASIVIAIFRFNTIGQLAALSLAPAEYKSVDG